MACVRPAPRCSATSPYSEVRHKSSPTQQGLGSAPSSQVRCRSSPATERRSCQLNLHSKELVEPINVANLRVNQRSQINEDTVEPSLPAQDNIRT